MTEARRIRIVKGNRRIGLSAHQVISVTEVTAMGADYSHMARVRLSLPGGRTKTLWARHPNRLKDSEFNLGNGSGVDKVRARFV